MGKGLAVVFGETKGRCGLTFDPWAIGTIIDAKRNALESVFIYRCVRDRCWKNHMTYEVTVRDDRIFDYQPRCKCQREDIGRWLIENGIIKFPVYPPLCEVPRCNGRAEYWETTVVRRLYRAEKTEITRGYCAAHRKDHSI